MTGYVEKPTLNYEVSMGIYAYDARVLEHVPKGGSTSRPCPGASGPGRACDLPLRRGVVRHRDARRARAGHGGDGQRSFGVDALNAGEPKPHLVQVLDYDRAQGGSFIPLIRGVLSDAIGRGWGVSVLLFESARGCSWVAELSRLGCEVKFASEELRSSDRALSQWIERSIPADGKVILHTHFTGFDVAGALVKRRRRETILLWHIHGVPPSDLRWRLRMWLKFGVLGRLVDAFLCPADNIVDAVRSHGAPRPRVHFVPSAIDVERFPIATQEERLEARRELGLPLDGVHLLHFGWHWYLKAGDIFLEALKLVLASEDEVVAIERGGGEEYVEYARKLGIEDKVVVTEAVDDVELLHSAADVLVC